MSTSVNIVTVDINNKRALYANPNRKPRILRVVPTGIPDDLTALQRWVLWIFVWKENKKGGGKWDKVPHRVCGKKASSTDPTQWNTFKAVYAAYQRRGAGDTRFDGIGFVLGDGFVGIDLDDVRNPDTGEILTPWAVDLIESASTYADVSPSGTGVKLIGKGEWTGDWHKKPHPSGIGEIEVYDKSRYFTITGVKP